MSQRSHEAVRTCIGCNQRDAQNALVRIAEDLGALRVDLARRAGGRGAYLHRSSDCLARFVRSKIREFRSLRRSIALDERRAIAERIAQLIQNAAGQLQPAEIK